MLEYTRTCSCTLALQPSQALRTHIRDRGGIPILIDLLNLDINGIINRTA